MCGSTSASAKSVPVAGVLSQPAAKPEGPDTRNCASGAGKTKGGGAGVGGGGAGDEEIPLPPPPLPHAASQAALAITGAQRYTKGLAADGRSAPKDMSVPPPGKSRNSQAEPGNVLRTITAALDRHAPLEMLPRRSEFELPDPLNSEMSLRHSEVMLARLFAASPDYITLTDFASNKLVLVNEAFTRITGYTPSEAIGRTALELNLWYDPAKRPGLVARLCESGELRDVPITLRAKDGQAVSVLLAASLVDVEGRDYMMAICRDITAAERTRVANEAILEHAMIGIGFTRDRVFQHVNPRFEQMFGWQRGTGTGKPGSTVWCNADDYAEIGRRYGPELGAGKVVEFEHRLRRADGAEIWCHLRAKALDASHPSRGGTVWLLEDITQKRAADEALAAARAQTERERQVYEPILDNALVGIAFTRDRVFKHANPRFDEIFGWPRGLLLGNTDAALSPDVESNEELRRYVVPLLAAGETVDCERLMKRRDGSLIWCRLRAKALSASEVPQSVAAGTIWIVEDITERRRAQDALAAAKEQAEAASRAKSAFLANTSHEIRTPLNGLLGLARLALAPDATQEKRDDYLRRIVESAESLASIISDILDISKIEAGRVTIDAVAFNLRDMLGAVRSFYGELAAAKGLNFELAIDARLPRFVFGDPVRVRQILGNYVSNALKFTEAGGVEVTVSPAGGERVRLLVKDAGIGIEPAALSNLFQPFMQADVSTTRRYGGTGLGLSICRQLAELMGGAVGCDSEPGKGSSFWAELPLPQAAQPDPARTCRDDAVLLAGARVLLVEDNPVNVLVAEALLREWGVDVEVASDGAQAVAAVARSKARFDAVLMDMHMPVKSGQEATRELRCIYSPRELPIIAVTAAVLVQEREQSFAIGMNDFIAKPIDADNLRATLARWIGARREAVTSDQ